MNTCHLPIHRLACVLALIITTLGFNAPAATLHVTNAADSGAGSLRAQVAAAASGDTIDFTIAGTITLLTEIRIAGKDLIVSGPGATSLTITTAAKSRAFTITNSETTIAGLTFDNCSCLTSGVETGGAIAVDNFSSGGADKITSITECAFTSNQAGWGGALDVFQGGLVLDRCTFSGNACTGLAFGTNGGGGAVSLGATVASEIRNCTFSGNAQNGGAADQPGGGAIFNFGIDASEPVPLVIEHCTFAGNVDASGSGGAVKSNFSGSYHTMSGLRNCLLVNNQAPSATLRNFAANDAATLPAAFASLGGNVTDEAQTSAAFMASGADGFGLPTLSASVVPTLSLNGGITATHAITRGSPAQQAGITTTITSDQRGAPRGGAPDAGAFELIEPELELTVDATVLAKGGTLDLGSAPFDTAILKSLTIRNAQTSTFTTGPLSLTGLTLPGGFGGTVPPSLALGNGESATFDITLPGTSTGLFEGELTFTGNDAFDPEIALIDGSLANGHGIHLLGLITDTVDHWRLQNFGSTATNTGDAADDASPAHDGLPNLLKYALGLSPTEPVPALGPIVIDFTPDGCLRMTVPKNPAATDIQLTIQVSSDLSDPLAWTDTGVMIDHNDPTMLQAHDHVDLSKADSRFIRLKVVRP